MANPTPTLRAFLSNLGPQDEFIVNGVKWTAERFYTHLVTSNDPRLSENVVESAGGVLTLYAAGMGAVDSTTPSMKAQTHTHK